MKNLVLVFIVGCSFDLSDLGPRDVQNDVVFMDSGMMDMTPPDSHVSDAGVDTDIVPDSGTDSGTDSGMDAGMDAGDAGMEDVPVDSGPDPDSSVCAGGSLCDGECTDLRSDMENCGSCGMVCDPSTSDRCSSFGCACGDDHPCTLGVCALGVCTL